VAGYKCRFPRCRPGTNSAPQISQLDLRDHLIEAGRKEKGRKGRERRGRKRTGGTGDNIPNKFLVTLLFPLEHFCATAHGTEIRCRINT